jgi:hypothetical protein
MCVDYLDSVFTKFYLDYLSIVFRLIRYCIYFIYVFCV